MLTALRFTAYDILRSELSVIQEDLLGFLFLDKPDQWEEFAALLEKTASPSSVREGKGIRLHNILDKIGHVLLLLLVVRSFVLLECLLQLILS